MTDNKLLQQLYSDLSDDQLTYKLLHESHELTDEALAVGKQEMANRNIDFEKLKLEQAYESVQKNNYEQFKLNNNKNDIADLLKHIITAKVEGKTDTDLKTALEKKGISPNITLSLIKEAKQQCKDKIDQTTNDLFYGSVSFIIRGIILFASQRLSKGTVIIIMVGALLFGIMKFLRGLDGLSKQKKLKKVIKNFN